METAVMEALRQVMDPEVGVNVVDLGLVYEVAEDDGHLLVRMTMTTPACPLGQVICEDAENAARAAAPGARSVEIALTFDPPWTADRVTPEGRRQLGWDA